MKINLRQVIITCILAISVTKMMPTKTHAERSPSQYLTSTTQNLERKMDKLLGTFSEFDGPNCFNAAFFSKSIYPYRIFTSTAQTAYLFDRFCTEISEDQASYGDIVRYSDKKTGVDSHAAIFLSRGSYFQKLKEFAYRSPYEITDERRMAQSLERDTECSRDGSCFNKTRFYSCQNGSEDQLKPSNEFERKIDEVAKTLTTISYNGLGSKESIIQMHKNSADLLKLSSKKKYYKKSNRNTPFWNKLLLDVTRQSHYFLHSDHPLKAEYVEAKHMFDNFVMNYMRNRLKSKSVIVDKSEYLEFLDLLNVSSVDLKIVKKLIKELQPTNNYSVEEQQFDLIIALKSNLGQVDKYLFPYLSRTNDNKMVNLQSFLNNTNSEIKDVDTFTKLIRDQIKNGDFQDLIGLADSIEYSKINLGSKNKEKLKVQIQNKILEIRSRR